MLSFRKSQDARAVRDVLAGRREAFDGLVRRYMPAVEAVAHSYLHIPTEVDDVVQDAFVSAYQNLPALRDPRKFEGWLIATVRNRCLSLLRSAKREAAAVESLARETGAASSSDVSRAELRRIVSERLNALDGQYREVLLLHYYAGRSTKDIARALDLSVAAVKKRLQRGREALGGDLLKHAADYFVDRDERARHEKKTCAAVAALPLLRPAAAAASAGTWAVAKPAALTAGVVAAGLAWFALSGGVLGGFQENAEDAAPAVVVDVVETSAPPLAEPEAAHTSALASYETDSQPADAEPLGDAPLAIAAVSTAPPQLEPLPAAYTDRLVSIEFENEHIARILDFLSQYVGVTFVLDYAAAPVPGRSELFAAMGFSEPDYATDGRVETIDLREVPLLNVLEELVYPLGLDFVLEPGFLWISTPQRIREEVQILPSERYDRYDIERLLGVPTTIEFADEHVSNILEFLCEYRQVNLVLDHRAVAPVRAASEVRDPVYPALSEVRHIKLRQIALRDALPALLRPLNLTHRLHGGIIWVSTPQRLKGDALIARNLPDTLFPAMTLELDNATIAEGLAQIAAKTNYSIEISPGLYPTLLWRGGPSLPIEELPVPALLAQNEPADRILAMLLWPHGLDFAIDGGVIRVAPRHEDP